MKYYDERPASEEEASPTEAARLSFLLFLIGAGWLYLLTKILPNVGLGAMISIPASVGALCLLAVGYFFLHRQQLPPEARRWAFWGLAAIGIFLTTALHPQASGKGSFTALWELLTG